jgi:hypothetical protein
MAAAKKHFAENLNGLRGNRKRERLAADSNQPGGKRKAENRSLPVVAPVARLNVL